MSVTKPHYDFCKNQISELKDRVAVSTKDASINTLGITSIQKLTEELNKSKQAVNYDMSRVRIFYDKSGIKGLFIEYWISLEVRL